MNRKAHTRPVTPQMYRHFAILTIAATMTLALFSNGENRKAVAREVAAHEAKPFAEGGSLVRHDGRPPAPRDASSGDDTFDDTFGQPMDRAGATPGGTFLGSGAAPGSGMPAGFTQFGVPASVWATLTEGQRKALVDRRKAEQDAAASPDREKQIDALMAASHARSGAGGPATD